MSSRPWKGLTCMARITPNLWFHDDGEEAAEFYCSVFPNSEVTRVLRYTEADPGKAGSVVTVDFTLDGQPLTIINGGNDFTLDEAFSLLWECEDQAEVDHYWATLTADGGQPGPCGWLKDRFGVSWQIVPKGLDDLLADPDAGRAARATKAMYGMSKIDLAAVQAAADGG
jgi:predicted 3-demethylubiquinone-9 3-methyltransferase (glyoxalase superfamily)